MNTLDLWKNVEKLTVDEFMHLLLGLEPGTENFSFYGRQFTWPKEAVPIYNMLAEDIKAGKLSVSFEGYWNDPRVNKQLVSHYAHTGEPWWEDGKLDKHELVKWLAEKNIQSEFYNVPQSISINEPTVAVHETPPQDVPGTPINLPPSPAEEQRTRIPVNVPLSLWGGKKPQAIFESLSDKGFAPEVIAYILMKKAGGVTKTDAGRMFYQEAINKGVVHDPKTYQRKIDDLLQAANAKYSFTFEE